LSTSQWEGLPTVLIQMMARGIPVVTSVVGGVEELATENTAWLVRNVQDPQEYVKRIRIMLLNAAEKQKKIENGNKHIQDRHTWNSFIGVLESLELVPSVSSEICEEKEIEHTDVSVKVA